MITFVLPARLATAVAGGLLSCLFVVFVTPTYAAETGLTPPQLQIDIPTLHFSADAGNWTGEYIAAVYKYAVGIVGIVAAVIMMFGGVLWLTSGGDASRVGEAKEWIKAALFGLIIALGSYTILFMVNPDLVSFRSLDIDKITQSAGPSGSSAYTPVRGIGPEATNRISFTGNIGIKSFNISGLKDHVNLSTAQANRGIEENMLHKLEQIIDWAEKQGINLQITSLAGGNHSNGSLHGQGRAADISVANLTGAQAQDIIQYWQDNSGGGRAWYETTPGNLVPPNGIKEENSYYNASGSGNHIHIDLNDPPASPGRR